MFQLPASPSGILDLAPNHRAIGYLCADGGILCGACVRAEWDRVSRTDPECPDDDQWRIINSGEAPDTLCDHCGRRAHSW